MDKIMSKVHMLRSFAIQRLSAAVDEIFDLYEKTIAEYEEEIRQSKEEKERQRKLLESVFNPEVWLNKLDMSQLFVKREEVTRKQQERSSRMTQEKPAEPEQIKKEQTDVWSSQEREQLQEPEADVKSAVPIPVKNEEDEPVDKEKPQSIQLHENQSEAIEDSEHVKTVADGEDCGGSEPVRIHNPEILGIPVTYDVSPFDLTNNNRLSNWGETLKTQQIYIPLQYTIVPMVVSVCAPGNPSPSSSERPTSTGQNGHPQENRDVRDQKRFSCSLCGKSYYQAGSLSKHMKTHDERYPCIFCYQVFKTKETLLEHLKIHTGQKPQESSENMSVDYTRSSSKSDLTSKLKTQTDGQLSQNMAMQTEKKLSSGNPVDLTRFFVIGDWTSELDTHTGKQLYPCKVCKITFSHSKDLSDHMNIHTGRMCTCSVCGKNMSKSSLVTHMKNHTGEVCGKTFSQDRGLEHSGGKALSCSYCEKRFRQRSHLAIHEMMHTRERPCKCPICGETYALKKHLHQHMADHTGQMQTELKTLLEKKSSDSTV